METEYDIGDEVYILSKEELENNDRSDLSSGVTTNMYKYCLSKTTITEKQSAAAHWKNTFEYKVKIDNSEYWWCSEYFDNQKKESFIVKFERRLKNLSDKELKKFFLRKIKKI